jgi:N-glycosylase/DNA lyase
VKGLRIVKMDEWECLVSFVLATYANIPRIAKMIETLSSRYGEEIMNGIRAFPTHDRLSEVSRTEMARLGLGYRAGYIHSLCKTIDGESVSRLRKLSFSSLREELKELPGVGDKVADCVSLFGFGRLEAFPIDVHIERALARLYHKKGPYSKLRTFASERFGEYAGYAQEYLFYNERLRAPGGACLFSQK